MSLLLDTNVWIWMEAEPERLSSEVARRLADPDEQLWISPLSVWELGLLVQKGRVETDRSIAELRDRLDARDAPVTSGVAMASHTLRLPTRDPADRLIAATAHVHELTLVTSDRSLIEHAAGQYEVLPAI